MSSKNRKLIEFERRISDMFMTDIVHIWHNVPEDSEKVSTFLNICKEKLKEYKPGIKTEVIDTYNKRLYHKYNGDDEAFINEVFRIYIVILTKCVTYNEMEDRSRKWQTERGYIMVGSCLSFERKSNKKIILHIPITFFENSKVAMKTFRENFEKLACIIEENPLYKNIKIIQAKSRFVKEKERLCKKFGFEVSEYAQDSTWGVAVISRDKLLELYGKKKEVEASNR